jgi:hypothetical protein
LLRINDPFVKTADQHKKLIGIVCGHTSGVSFFVPVFWVRKRDASDEIPREQAQKRCFRGIILPFFCFEKAES